ncbi:MAG TPA: Lrp/AsnC family transcriptional regulator [Nitrosopumilaceae archaeon]|nr:Lrp/AsnC family transcriptional regulator [Nitrosopumilaceae archaeon]
MGTAYFLLNVELNHEVEVIEKIKKILTNEKTINYELQGVFGIYDIVLKINSNSDDDIRHKALDKIKHIDKIQSVITMMVNDN